MPSFNIVKTVDPENTFRVAAIRGSFDLSAQKITEKFNGSIDIESKEWNVGLIVGGSGTGKSTIARELFSEYYIKEFSYSGGSIVDDMPKAADVSEITKTFAAVGFSSPPSWLKPYMVLSEGEKMRVNLARAILEGKDIIVFDEFTSVVNREVAKTGSYAISKAIKRAGKKFIAVSCHRDIIEWLEPDWVYDTDEKRFFFLNIDDRKSIVSLSSLIKKPPEKYGRILGVIII